MRRALRLLAQKPPPRLALIHAMQPSIASSIPAFQQLWPEAELVHLMDDSLARDVGRTGLDESMSKRFQALGRYAHDAAGCDGILFTCSAFGSAIEAVQRELRTDSFPVLKPNEAMMAEAARLGLGEGGKRAAPIAVFSIFEPTLPSILRELQDIGGGNLDLRPHFIPNALDELNAGDEQKCIRTIAKYVNDVAMEAHSDQQDLACMAFAMFSMARASSATEELLKQSLGARAPPVLTSPCSAVQHMKKLLGH
mmetsp:Transcript_139651/g.348247  ORF Transcript_139651/g.348247 Transcript_139651/m.348247 type:complete len:253 (+) Transcript_139651:88-846(+)